MCDQIHLISTCGQKFEKIDPNKKEPYCQGGGIRFRQPTKAAKCLLE